MVATIILAVLALLVLFWAVGAYKRLVRLRNQLRHAFAQVDAQFRHRHDLVPNLVETAKGYMKNERETLEAVIAARNGAVAANGKAAVDASDAGTIRQLAVAEDALTAALRRMFALSEACPELKSSPNMAQLAEELAGTENRIAFARQVYNDGVMQYNASREQFPVSIIAIVFAFRPGKPLESAEAPEVSKEAKPTV